MPLRVSLQDKVFRNADPIRGFAFFFAHMMESTSITQTTDIARFRAVIEPIAYAHGASLVSVELKNESGWVLRVYVEKAGTESADLELCAAISKDLSPALDVADLIPQRYNLEVSSPGLERPLFGEGDFRRFQGRKAKIKLRHASASTQKVFVGEIGPMQGANMTVVEGKHTHELPLADIEKARLVFELERGPKRK
jgi:ribosome maturation factor RimP